MKIQKSWGKAGGSEYIPVKFTANPTLGFPCESVHVFATAKDGRRINLFLTRKDLEIIMGSMDGSGVDRVQTMHGDEGSK